MREAINYYASSNSTDHARFGGNIYNYDFDGYNSMSDIASRIISDMKFDEKCRKNIENRKIRKEKTN